MGVIKNILKKYFGILKVRNRISASSQVAQRHLLIHYQDLVGQGRAPKLADTGFRVFSQFEEDGLLLFIFSVLGMGSRKFIEIGSDDGINSNCANLVLNFGWHGLFIDSNKTSIDRGRYFYSRYPHPWWFAPTFRHAYVTPENINQVIEDGGYVGDIELLSIDIDGDDYWIWKAIQTVRPKVVVIETHVMFGERNIVVPYAHPDSKKYPDYHGASPVAMIDLAREKGYDFIGANQLGFNFIFLRSDLVCAELPVVHVHEALGHSSVQDSYEKFEAISHLEYVTP